MVSGECLVVWSEKAQLSGVSGQAFYELPHQPKRHPPFALLPPHYLPQTTNPGGQSVAIDTLTRNPTPSTLYTLFIDWR